MVVRIQLCLRSVLVIRAQSFRENSQLASILFMFYSMLNSGGGQGGGNPEEQGWELGGKREVTERDAGVMCGWEAGEE